MAIKQSWGYVIPEINPQIGFGGLSYDGGLAPVNMGTSKAKKKAELIKNMIGGESSPAAGLLGLADLAVNTASDIADGIKPIDDSASLEQLQAFGNQSLTAGSTTDILNLYSPLYNMPQKRDKYDYGYLDDGKALGSIASSALRGASSGAAAGSAILPGLGTIIGGIGGALIGWGSNLFKTQKNNNQAKSAAEEYNEALDEAQQNYLNNIATANTNMQQRNLRNQLASTFAFGGKLDDTFTNGVTMIGNGGTHEANINGGVQMGIAPDGLPNMVEEGEAIYNDYVFSNRLKVPKAIRQKYKLKGETFADAFKQAQKESEERPNDPISKNGLENIAMILTQSQEELKSKKESKKFACGGAMHKAANGNLLRYLEPLGSVVGLGYNLFDPYRPAEVSVGNAPMIASQSIGDYIAPEQFDRNYWMNQLAATSAATRRAVSNQASPASAANVLAADYNAGLQAGQMARAGQEYNREQAIKTAEFNRGTNQLNAQLALQAASRNQATLSDYDRMRLNAAQFNVQTKDAWKRGFDQAIGVDTHAIFESLGKMGKERTDYDFITNLAKAGVFGPEQSLGILSALGYKACGGKIKTKKKKGLTY